MQWVNDWITQSACRDQDPDALFVQGAAQNRAKQVCGGCVVRVECLADALDNRIEFGVWGGMTERERRALLRHASRTLIKRGDARVLKAWGLGRPLSGEVAFRVAPRRIVLGDWYEQASSLTLP